MRSLLRSFIALVLVTPALAAAPPAAPPYHSLTAEFARFYDETVTMPEAARVRLFRERFNALLPGFYEPTDGQSEAQFEAGITRHFASFPALRARYEATERNFPRAYAAGLAHFRAQFPGFEPVLPVWFVHSLGRMDGGTRMLRGRNTMIFGADVIARIHDARDIGPFLDHEMFHVESGERSAVQELMALHIDMAVRKVAPMPADLPP